MTHRAWRSGYTLFELLIVVGILSVASAIVLPFAMSTLDSKGLKTIASSINRDLNTLRLDALRSGFVHRFQFTNDASQYTLFAAGDSEGQSGKLRQLSGLRLKSLHSKPGEVISIAFQPDGTASSGEFKLIDHVGNRITFSIDRLTGEARVSRVQR